MHLLEYKPDIGKNTPANCYAIFKGLAVHRLQGLCHRYHAYFSRHPVESCDGDAF